MFSDIIAISVQQNEENMNDLTGAVNGSLGFKIRYCMRVFQSSWAI